MEKFKIYLTYLIYKKPIVYISIFLLIGYMITIIINNKLEEIRKEEEIKKQTITRLDNQKKKFIDSEVLKLKPMEDKEKELKLELDTLKSKIQVSKKCINGVKSTLGTLGRYDCTKQPGFLEIEKASAEEVIEIKPVIQTWWLKNSQWISKSKEELRGNTFTEISEAHWIAFDYWHEAEATYKIKKEVALCIARADSGLGKYLKTKNNIGNVGNNDRWDKVAFASMQDWVNAIFKVLNNKYLSHKQSIWSLSPWGWWTAPFYATSKENWSVNVRNCLSIIHWQPIGNDYKIRL